MNEEKIYRNLKFSGFSVTIPYGVLCICSCALISLKAYVQIWLLQIIWETAKTSKTLENQTIPQQKKKLFLILLFWFDSMHK